MVHRWRGGASSCGSLSLPLRKLVGGGRVEGQRRLEGGAGAVVQLEAQYKPYF